MDGGPQAEVAGRIVIDQHFTLTPNNTHTNNLNTSYFIHRLLVCCAALAIFFLIPILNLPSSLFLSVVAFSLSCCFLSLSLSHTLDFLSICIVLVLFSLSALPPLGSYSDCSLVPSQIPNLIDPPLSQSWIAMFLTSPIWRRSVLVCVARPCSRLSISPSLHPATSSSLMMGPTIWRDPR